VKASFAGHLAHELRLGLGLVLARLATGVFGPVSPLGRFTGGLCTLGALFQLLVRLRFRCWSSRHFAATA